MNKTTFITALVSTIMFALVLGCLVAYTCNSIAEINYEQGYKDACKDFYKGKVKYDLVTNPDGTREWKKIHAWDDKNYFDTKLAHCPKCGSFNVMENGQRGRMPITSLRCKDCGHIWKIK